MKESGITLRGQITVYKGNVGIVPDIYDEVSNLNIYLNLSLFRHQNKEQMSQNRAEDLIPYLEKYFAQVISRIYKGEYHGNQSSFDYMDLSSVRNSVCGAGSNYIVLDSNKDIYTCHESIKFGKPL